MSRSSIPKLPKPDPDALLCALVLAPQTFPRNRFFGLFEDPSLRGVRRRAKRVRGIIRQLAGHGQPAAEIIGEQILDDRVLMRFQIPHVNYERTTSLDPLEAALVQFAVQRAKNQPCDAHVRDVIEGALSRVNITLSADNSVTPQNNAKDGGPGEPETA